MHQGFAGVRLPAMAVLLVGLGLLDTGCAQQKGIVQLLPPPVFGSAQRPARLRPTPQAPIPPPVARPAPPAVVGVQPGWMPPGGINSRWKCVVIHHSAGDRGSAASFDKYHRESLGWDELGYHFVIGNGMGSGDGLVEVGSRWRKQKTGAHCKTSDNYYNKHGVGICLVGNFEQSDPTARQMGSLTALVRFLLDECGISPSQVVTHGGVTGRTACPGRNFPLAVLKSRLNTVSATDGYR